MNGTTLTKSASTTVLPGATLAASPTTAQADPILFWNLVALDANRDSHTNGAKEQNGPPLSARALAIVHLAMYDAYARVIADPARPIYLDTVTLPAPATTPDTADAIAAAAVAAAAHTTLSVLFPSLSGTFNQRLAENGDPANPGHAFGVQVAVALLQDRAADPGAGDCGYVVRNAPGNHRPDPDNAEQGFHAPCYGSQARAFAITNPTRHALKAPPFNDAEYRAALAEVRARGIAPELMGTLPSTAVKRTPAETVRGIFWGYDGAAKLGTPPRFYNQIVREIALARGNTVAQNAELFALINVAMADAGVLAWEQKYDHNFWRPVVGIRENDPSMGPDATANSTPFSANCDPEWLPLGAPSTNKLGSKNFTPPFPAYPSGHATFGAAALHMTRLFYGTPSGDRSRDDLCKAPNAPNTKAPAQPKNIAFVSEEFDGHNQDNHGTFRPRHVREFPDGLWQMIIENGTSRVDLGVHWIFDAFAVKTENGVQVPDFDRNIGGVVLGVNIAEDIWAHKLHRSTVGPLASTGAGQGPAAFGPNGVGDDNVSRPGGSWQDRIAYP